VPIRTQVLAVLAGGTLLAGCSLTEQEHDLVAGKRLFAERCGSCHVLERAGTRGVAGPDLDAAFRQALRDGMDREGIRGMVASQIAHPARVPESSPAYMPANLVRGREAEAVAAYVAQSVARPGEDTGLLAEAVPQTGDTEPAVARDGVLEIPSLAQLAYATERAQAEPGELEIRSPNPSGTPHNIAVEGPGGVREIGEVVQDGGTSTVRVTVQEGEYAFFCTVPGHREGGMEGVLTVAEGGGGGSGGSGSGGSGGSGSGGSGSGSGGSG
jgi:mono/diheme cytochrome c family protein